MSGTKVTIILVEKCIKPSKLWAKPSAKKYVSKFNLMESFISGILITGLSISTLVNHGCHINPHKDEELRLRDQEVENKNKNVQQVSQSILKNDNH